MKTLGEIIAVLNEDYVLIKSPTVRLKANEQLYVYERTSTTDFSPNIGLKEIIVPQGHIRVVLRQNDNMYLANTFQKYEYKRPQDFGLSGGGIIASMLATVESYPVPAGKSATVNKGQSLGLKFSSDISVGDEVGREG